MSAPKEIAERLTPTLRDYAVEFGLPREVADTLKMVWEDDTFQVISPLNLDAYEYGQGREVPKRPILKATNRLVAEAEDEMREAAFAAVAAAAQEVRF